MSTKRFLVFFLFMILMGTALSNTLNLDIVNVSAAPLSPYIMIVPEQTINSTIIPGMNFTISVYTDYDGSDIWGWEFNLAFNPAILQGIEVRNGDLITIQKDPSAKYYNGSFNNIEGTLALTTALFFYTTGTPPTTTGPGTFAFVTFEVVGTGISDITIGSQTTLITYVSDQLSPLIDSREPPGATQPPYGSDHIGHGYFNNIPPVHDIAVRSLAAPATAVLGENVTIDVTVANEGNFTETFDVTVDANTTQIGTQAVTSLETGNSATLTFIWSTTGIAEGSYTINATVMLTDDDMSDNSRNATTEIKAVHDIALVSLQIPSQVFIGDLVAINVTVANQGSFEEYVNLTITYDPTLPQPKPVPSNTVFFSLAKLPTSETVSVNWNTSGLAKSGYNITATVTIDQDEDASDNTQFALIELRLGHDIALTELSVAPSEVFVGGIIGIEATVKNVGGFNETLIEVRVTFDSNVIGSQQVPSLPTGDLKTLSFTWNTTGVAPRVYNVEVEALLDGDTNPANNHKLGRVDIAAPTGHVAGMIKDASTGNPIEGAQITANGYSATTDVDGYYNITNVLAGTYNVTVSRNGYESSSSINIVVAAGETTNVDFELEPKQTSDISGILPYVIVAAVAVIVVAGIIVILLRKRKAK